MKRIIITIIIVFMKKYKFHGFTLVELIIVITILSILSTIAFVSFQNYTKDTRDSARLTTLKNIETGLQTFQITTGNYPEPENHTLIQASGSNIGYQGYIGDLVAGNIKINKTPLDPLDNQKFIYSTDIAKTKYQLMAFLEGNNQLSFINQTYATDYTQRNPRTLGDSLGIILETNNQPITGTGIDIFSGVKNYIFQFTSKDFITTNNINTIFTNYYKYHPEIFTTSNNLLSNGGFENDMSGWGENINTQGGGYSEILSTNAYLGTKMYHATRIVPSGLTPAILSDQYSYSNAYFGGSIISGRMFRVSCMIKTNGMDSGTKGIRIATYWNNNSGWIWQNNNSSEYTKPTEWIEISAVGIAPNAAIRAFLIVHPDVDRTNANGEYWMDDCKLNEIFFK